MDEPITVSSELLARIRTGDEKAWREMVRILNPLVSKIIRNQVRRNTDHEDIAQEAFTKIFLKLDQFAGHQPFTCLLYTSPSPRDVEESRMPSSA